MTLILGLLVWIFVQPPPVATFNDRWPLIELPSCKGDRMVPLHPHFNFFANPRLPTKWA